MRARHDELLEVESSVKGIRDVFVQMATLVEVQVKSRATSDMQNNVWWDVMLCSAASSVMQPDYTASHPRTQ
jgi:hypothetical protein